MATSSDVIKSFTIKVNTDNGKIKIDGLTKSYVKADKAIDQMTNGLKQNTAAATTNAKAHKQVDAAVGGASAVSLEFGRVISDAPYGIRGVANNITQMASQFTQLTTKMDKTTGEAVGFKRALKTIGGTLLGPTGILIAITAVVAAVDYFAGGMSSAKESVEDMNDTLKDQIQIVNLLENEFLASNVALEDRLAIMKGLSRVDSKMAKQLAAANGDKVEEARLIKKYREQKELELKLREKEFAIKQASDKYEESKERQRKFRDGEMGTFQFGPNFQKTTENMEKELLEQEKLVDEYVELLKGFEKDEETSGRSRLRVAKVFKEKYLDLQKIILDNTSEMKKVGQENKIELLKIEQETADEELMIKYDTYREKEKMRLDNFLLSIKGTKGEAKAAADARSKFKFEMIEAENDLGEAKLAVRLNWAKKIAFNEAEIARESYNMMTDDIFDIISRFDSAGDDALFDYNEARIKKANEMREKALNANVDAAVDGGDEIKIMEASKALADFQFQAQEDELNRDQKHYNDKKKIVQEYIGFAKNIGSALGKLAGDNEAMQKAALLINKGAATADVVVNAQKQLMAARTAHLARVAAAAGNPIAERASSLKLLADKTKTVVGAGASIANIWATSVNKKNNVGGGSGGEGGGRTFDFNLVGSTGTNQAAQTTAGLLGQPVQAYVVSSDITSQQQLDNNIQGQASFGEDDD